MGHSVRKSVLSLQKVKVQKKKVGDCSNIKELKEHNQVQCVKFDWIVFQKKCYKQGFVDNLKFLNMEDIG